MQSEDADVIRSEKATVEEPSEEISCEDIANVRHLGFSFWVLNFALFFSAFANCSFINNFDELIVKRFNIDYEVAGVFMTLPYGIGAVLCIIVGKLMNVKAQWKSHLLPERSPLLPRLYRSVLHGKR